MDYYGSVIGIKWRNAHGVKGRKREDGIVFTTTLALRYAWGRGYLQGWINDLDGLPPNNDTGPVRRRHTVHEMALYLGSSLYF